VRALFLALLLLPLAAAAQQAQVTYYDVQGADLRGLLASLNARGPHHGRADWKVSYRFTTRPGGGGCAVESLSTELDLQMTLPRWSPPAGASRDLVARWERYLAALRVHEEGHLDHGRDFAREVKV
jgi:predicted secreted Zn-dependent protease